MVYQDSASLVQLITLVGFMYISSDTVPYQLFRMIRIINKLTCVVLFL